MAMIADEKQTYTPAEYLMQERNAVGKSEYFNGEISVMAGATANHTAIQANVSGLLYNALRRQPCRFFPNDLRVHIPATTLYTYPDFSIVCGKPAFLDGTFDTLLNPAALIEILSKETASYDRGDKFESYRSIPTLEEYILVDSRRVKAEVWRKEQGRWVLVQETSSVDDAVIIETINAAFALQDVYELTEGLIGNE